jgi:4-aminobutyrate aminotransferase-like enzyme
MQRMRQWCDENQILLTCDEVQAGFGRTGKFSGFEHYGIVPDLSTWGKGISSSLPIACIIGSREVMDLFPPGSMTSTHSGNPVCAAAALASLDLILNENLVENARVMGDRMLNYFHAMKAKYPQIGWVDGKGLVAGIACVKPGTKEPDADLAWNAIRASIERGVLMFSPVGFGGGTIKVCPPLNITQEAVDESLAVFEEAFVSCL